MFTTPQAIGIEINPKLVGVLLTERTGEKLRLFCYYINAEISQFDVPAAENIDNLQHLFAELKLDANCTSLIVDEVVQGRVFFKQNEQYWLYTLLKSPGSTPPPLNADIAELPWRVIWRSQEAEMVQYGRSGDREHCFAIRTQVSEADVARMMQSSKAFINPVSIPRKKPQPGLYAKLLMALLTGCILLSAPTIYAFKQINRSNVAVSASPKNLPILSTDGVYLLFQHRITGPYPAQIIAGLNAGGLFPAETLCRPEKSADWIKLTELPLPGTKK
jgi:hypothetical protein